MDNLKYYHFFIFFGLISVLGACAPKITNPKIENLERNEAGLILKTHLNQLYLAVEREKLSVIGLTKDANRANETANIAVEKSRSLSVDLINHAGDAKLAKKALRASKRAKKDSKKASKENSRLSDSNKKIEEYLKDIEKTKSQIEEFDANK